VRAHWRRSSRFILRRSSRQPSSPSPPPCSHTDSSGTMPRSSSPARYTSPLHDIYQVTSGPWSKGAPRRVMCCCYWATPGMHLACCKVIKNKAQPQHCAKPTVSPSATHCIVKQSYLKTA